MFWYMLLYYAEVLAWPIVAVVGVVLLKGLLEKLLNNLPTGSRVRVSISGVVFSVRISELEKSISASLRNRRITVDQWSRLQALKDKGRQKYHARDYGLIVPLRNAGLVLEHPEGTLTDCEEIEITPLGELLVDAKNKSG